MIVDPRKYNTGEFDDLEHVNFRCVIVPSKEEIEEENKREQDRIDVFVDFVNQIKTEDK